MRRTPHGKEVSTVDTPWTQDATTSWLAHCAIVADEWVGELISGKRKRTEELLELARRKRQEALDELVRRGEIDSYDLV